MTIGKNEFTLMVVQEGHCMKHSNCAGKSNRSTSLAMIQGYFYIRKNTATCNHNIILSAT